MKWDGGTDRRRHRRAAIRIRSEFGDESSTTWIETVDFSVGGFSCWMNHPVRSLTKLALKFDFPPFGVDLGKRIDCEAVVVRCEKRNEPVNTWSVAAAFTGLGREDRDYITRYVDWQEIVMDPDSLDADLVAEGDPGPSPG